MTTLIVLLLLPSTVGVLLGAIAGRLGGRLGAVEPTMTADAEIIPVRRQTEGG